MSNADSNAGSSAPSAGAPAPLRRFGRFELRALLSKSSRSMLWLVLDPRSSQELMLCMPRQAPNSPAALTHWLKMADTAARVQHPNLAHVVEVGQVEHWPYLAYDRALGETLDERLSRQGLPLPVEAAQWLCQGLEGLAFAHEAGHAHRDVQSGSWVVDAAGHVRLLGLEVAQDVFPANTDFNTLTRRALREAAEEDVLRTGLVLHRVLTGRAVLDEADLNLVLQRMQPQGSELVRLSFETPQPIAEPLRAIANRSVDRQARQRYHSARSFLRALEGWRGSVSEQGGMVAQLLDRLQRVGHLPIASLRLQRIAQSSAMESTHASELSTLVLQDMALSLEMLRRVNNALKSHGQSVSGGAILNMQRAIAMLGLNGVQQAARGLKPWPGPLNEAHAARLQSLMRRVQRAGQVAQVLRPAGYDAEVVYLITVMQNLGRLLLQYHFPEDAQQIRQLMQAPEPTAEQPNPSGMSEQSAAFAVLGCDLETLGTAVARYWSLGDELLHMMRRYPPDAPVRAGAHPGDVELLRLTCSLANELIEALDLPEHKRQIGVELATRRYARILGLGLRDVLLALNPETPAEDSLQAQPAETVAATVAPAVTPGAPQPSALRNRLRGRTDGSELPLSPPASAALAAAPASPGAGSDSTSPMPPVAPSGL
ncbi:MAG: HDOD domain-containing protein [Roseateles sp.]